MKKIKILASGPLKFNFIRDGLEYYKNKISPFISLEPIIPKIKTSGLNKEQKLIKEEKVLRKYLSPKDYLIILDERGKMLKSIELARHLEKILEIHDSLCFIIGGPEGISKNLKNEAQEILSLSSLTLNHEIALLVLLEAIYRSFTIIKKFPYHRE